MATTTVNPASQQFAQQVAQAFSQQAEAYHLHSQLQADVAQHFAQWLYPQLSLPATTVVEVGAGTGHLTHHLPHLFSGTESLWITDVAEDMLAENQRQFNPNHPTVGVQPQWLVWNANYPLAALPQAAQPIHTLTGSMCLHWLNNWADTVAHWQQHTQQLAFAVLTQGTLAQWQQLCKDNHAAYQGPHYPTVSQVFHAFSPQWQLNLQTETFCQTHPSAWAFAQHLKVIGAHTPTTAPNKGSSSTGFLRQLAAHHGTGTATPFTASYTVTFLHAVRN